MEVSDHLLQKRLQKGSGSINRNKHHQGKDIKAPSLDDVFISLSTICEFSMKEKTTILLITLSAVFFFSFINSHRHKIQVLFKNEKALFENLTINGKPNLKACYIRKGEILGIRQSIAYFSEKGIEEHRKKGFFINAYNLAVLAELNEHYPIQSMEEAPAFFDSKDFLVAKKTYNLQSLRKHIVEKFEDPRIHFALYLGGNSSPNIPTHAFFRLQVDQALNEICTTFINDLSSVKIKTRSKMVLLPEFMLWNKADFNVKNDQEFLAFINLYRSKERQIPQEYKIAYYPYSWNLYK